MIATSAPAEDGDLRRFFASVYQAWDSGFLPEPIAVFVLLQYVTNALLEHSPDGYIKDPAIDRQSQLRFIEFFAKYGLHKMVTLTRKYPEKLTSISNEGMVMLFGDREPDPIVWTEFLIF